MVKSDMVAKMWIARDMSGTGLYTLWADNHPMLDEAGYYKASSDKTSVGTLLMTIHSSKFPWESIALDRGECKAFILVPAMSSDRSIASQASMGNIVTPKVSISEALDIPEY